MVRTAKVSMNSRIRKEGDSVLLSPRPQDWSAYLDSGPVASDEFLKKVDDLPAQEREF